MLGRTGRHVSRLGLGLAALGRPGYVNLGHAEDLGREYDEAAMERHAHEVMDAAWVGGVRYFDAARSYGEAERFLRDWLVARRHSPSDVTIGSKWGYTYTAGWRVDAASHEVKEHSRAALRRQWAESAALLRPYLNLYQVHSATRESGVLASADVLDDLARLKSEGVHVGLTLSGPDQAATLREAMAIERDGLRLFETVQATWNLLEPSAGPALSEAHATGLGVIVKESLANGRLTERNREPAFRGTLDMLRSEASRHGVGIDALALAVCLAQPFADVVLVGAATTAQLDANLKAVTVTLDDETRERLAGLAEPPAAYWERRRGLPWN